jgi:hypothetical protein
MMKVNAFWMVGSSVSISFLMQSVIIFSGSTSSSIDLNSSSVGIKLSMFGQMHVHPKASSKATS